MTSLTLRIRGYDLPGLCCVGRPNDARPARESVHVGIQRRREVVDLVPGDAVEATWEISIDVDPGRDGGTDFRGPHVQGKPGERFVYLSWGEVAADGQFAMFRRAKLWLGDIDEALLREAVAQSVVIEGRLPLTDRRGGPLCASVRPPLIHWYLIPV
jgi:hypothetical protein